MQIKGVEFDFVALTCYILYWTNKTTQSDANKNVKLDSVFVSGSLSMIVNWILK